MIDLRAARAEPDAWRAALARKGAGEAFDELLAADERWRALVPRVDDLRGATKLKGKPTPQAARGAAAASRKSCAPRRRSSRPRRLRARRRWRSSESSARVCRPTAIREDDAVELRRFG